MAEFPAFTPSPAHVHRAIKTLTGHRACWVHRPYGGGIWRTDHYRVCSYCNCIHPADMMELLRAGNSRLEKDRKDGKHILVSPNPIAGELVQMGSLPGAVFPKKRQPADLVSHLLLASRDDLGFEPTIGERLAGHFERPCLEPAPAHIRQPLYVEHTTEPQWAEIEAAVIQGAQHVASLPGA